MVKCTAFLNCSLKVWLSERLAYIEEFKNSISILKHKDLNQDLSLCVFLFLSLSNYDNTMAGSSQ